MRLYRSSSPSEINIYQWEQFLPFGHQMTCGITGSRVDFADPAGRDQNLKKLLPLPGLQNAEWALAGQVHGTRISPAQPGHTIKECDGIYLTEPGTVAAVFLGDCLPVLVYDPEHCRGIICHAGRRGINEGIAEQAVRLLVREGGRASQFCAAAGPGIGPCCYTVASGTAREFAARFRYPENVVFHNPDGQYVINLEAAALARLNAEGVRHTASGGFCTACRSGDFFSYRNEHHTSRRYIAFMYLH